MRFFSAESLNLMAPTWLDCARAALLQGLVTLAFVGLFWLVFRKHLSNAFAHGLFFLVPVKTAAAGLFVAWPVVISFSVPVSESIFSAVYPPPALEIGSKTAMSGQMQSLDLALEQPKAPVKAVAGGPIADMNTIGESVDFNATQVVTTQETPAATPPQVSISAKAWLLLVWAGVCGLLVAVNFLKHMRMLKRFNRLAIDYSEINQQKLNELASAMGLGRTPRLVESSGVATPAVIGLARPILVVPTGFFESFDADEQAWILLHELAHIRRRDLWWLAFERAVGVTFFFHPALWISSRATRHFRELACDDLAQMQSGFLPRHCAETFLKLIHWSLRHQSGRGSITPRLSLTDRYPAIQRRIMNMTELNSTNRWNRLSKGSFAILMATAILISLPFSPKLVAKPRLNQEKSAKHNPAPAATKTEIKPVAAVEKRSEPPKTIKIGGIVVDENDKPIEGATAHVTVYYPKIDNDRIKDEIELESRPTDDQGKWSIDGVPGTSTTITLELNHPQKILAFRYGSYHQKPFKELRSGDLKMQMKDGMKLTIRVKDGFQNPVKGAAIFDVSGYRRERNIPIGYTNSKGEFTSEKIFPGPNRFIMTEKTYGPALLSVDAQASTPVQEVTLRGGRTVSGTIIDWNGKPMSGGEVRLGSFRDVGEVPNYLVKTDANGHFEMKDLPWEPVVLTIFHQKMIIEKPINTNMSDLGRFRVGPVNSLKLHVTDAATGKPVTAIANYRFSAVENSTSLFTTIGLKHNSEGLFEDVFYPAKAEKFRVLVLAEGYEPYLTEQQIEFDETHTSNELNVALKKHANIITYRGKAVQPDGKPAAGFTVRFTPMNPGVKVGQMHFTWQIGEFKEIKTADDGSFEFQNPGPIQELLIVGEDDSFYSNQMTGWKGEIKSLVLSPKAIISGRVTENGKPRYGVQVSPMLVRLDIYIPLWNGLQNSAFTDSQGHYRLPCIYPGTIQLNFSNDHNGAVGKNYEIKPGEKKTIDFDFNETRMK